ncbi:NUDIX domain-containing protein [Thioalkalivibrio sulfidiphilus]|uniref:NUDIX domain-containing protein n=1 Tax=Thioalkalivibrio sulfidiphilus TaxID=1033854 RepID=UPI0003763B1B|nr:NUDIX hydrolase [Thioalkalivibrio sulfidiphilus]
MRPVTPLIAVDLIIRLAEDPHTIVLIERRNPPHGWALPGGFVDVGETLEAAAVREAREETCLEVRLEALLGCYSDPARDPRGHTVSAVYVANGRGEPRAADDARNLRCVDARDPGLPLVFDHGRILADYLRWLKTGEGKKLGEDRMTGGSA